MALKEVEIGGGIPQEQTLNETLFSQKASKL